MGSKQSKLTPRQMSVIADLFEGGLDEAGVLAKHKVSAGLYRKWLADDLFADEIKFRIESARRAGKLIIARYAPVAAAKLVGLIDSDKAETVRKACLDILDAGRQEETATFDSISDESGPDLPPDVASKLLAVLAEQSQADNSNLT
ncbi:MAG TPA: hypothetical protein HPP87_09640 [Planctomycetes bacterium]|nr:hypothetical protein [Planctomycetota bacterium]HIJ71608.1 hypothetical protein [Planctomycetota bacterium]